MASGSTPPRRRAPAPPPRSPSLVPLVALFLGVLVAGLGIGVALSLLGKSRGGPPPGGVGRRAPIAEVTAPPEVATPAGEPSLAPTLRPAPTARPTPTTPPPSPTPEASSSPTDSASPEPSASPRASASPQASPLATPASATPAAVVTRAAAAATSRPATPKPATAAPATATPATAAPAPSLPPTSPPGGGDATMSGFSRQSSEVVRQFLTSLIAGDDATARDTLVDAHGDLPESAILDQQSRIRNVVAHGTDDTSEVTLTIETPNGNWSGRYFLIKSAAGNPQIRAHDISKL